MDLVDQAELFNVLIFVPVVREVVVPLGYAWYVEVASTGRAEDNGPRGVSLEGQVGQVIPGFVSFFEVAVGRALG
jgi:hypothetical protein